MGSVLKGPVPPMVESAARIRLCKAVVTAVRDVFCGPALLTRDPAPVGPAPEIVTVREPRFLPFKSNAAPPATVAAVAPTQKFAPAMRVPPLIWTGPEKRLLFPATVSLAGPALVKVPRLMRTESKIESTG